MTSTLKRRRGADMTKQKSTRWEWLAKQTSVLGVVASVAAGSFSLYLFFLPVEFLVSSSPPGAVVGVDGEERGTTPLALQLKRGVHQVKLTLNGYQEERRVVRLVAGADKSLFVTLRAEPQSVQPPLQNTGTIPPGDVEQRITMLASELAELKAAIVDDPTEVVSLEVIRSRLNLFETQIATTERRSKDSLILSSGFTRRSRQSSWAWLVLP